MGNNPSPEVDSTPMIDKEESTGEERIILGWLILRPVYMIWTMELIYMLLTCWVCLSSTYWINYPGLSKR